MIFDFDRSILKLTLIFMVKKVLGSTWRTGREDGDVDGGWRMRVGEARWTVMRKQGRRGRVD